MPKFFDLACELRDIVYDELWKSSPLFRFLNTYPSTTRVIIKAAYFSPQDPPMFYDELLDRADSPLIPLT